MSQPAADAARPARSHFTMIPDMVGDLDLDPYAFRLYCHLRRVVGEPKADGTPPRECWQSTRTLARHCHMSMGKVSQAKRQLLALGLIRIEKRPGPGGRHDAITVVDLWDANRRHFAAPAPDPARPTVPAPAPTPLLPPGTARSPTESGAPSAHERASTRSLHPANATPSPGETNQIPPTQTSSSRKENEGDEDGGEGRDDRPLTVITRLFTQELGAAPTPLQREAIARLVALCDDPAVWRRAFVRSTGARNRWAYTAQCVRNAARSLAQAADIPSRSYDTPEPRGCSPPARREPARAPDAAKPDYVKRWERVLQAVSWKQPPGLYREGFGATTCIGERDGGRTLVVAVPRPAFLGWITHPSHRPFVERVMRQCGYEDTTVEFVLAEPAPGATIAA